LSYVAARQTRELYKVTFAEYSRGVQSKEFIAMMRPVNRCSLLTRSGIWTHRQFGNFRVLFSVFGHLLRGGLLTQADLGGLQQEKIEETKLWAISSSHFL